MTTKPISLPAIRTAMRMSRSIVQPAEAPSEMVGGFSAAADETHPMHFAGSVRSSVRKATIRHKNTLSNSTLPSALANSPYLSPVVKRRPQWSLFQQEHPDKLYTDWEIDECRLEHMTSLSPKNELRLGNDLYGRTFNSTGRKVTLFRPKPQKTTNIQRPIQVNVRRTYIRKVNTDIRNTVIADKRVAEKEDEKEPVRDFKIYPTLKLTAIESDELNNSSGSSPITPHLRKKRQSIAKVPGNTHISPTEPRFTRNYTEETAEVLGDTRSIVRRRSQRMVIAARLLRNAN